MVLRKLVIPERKDCKDLSNKGSLETTAVLYPKE